MLWGSPHLLWLLWLVPVVALLLIYAQRKRLAAARAFLDPPMAARLLPPLDSPRVWVKALVLLLGLTSLVLAAARPRWGLESEEVTHRGVDLFVLLDVSRSMLAEDVKPNRLERAKSDIRDLLAQLKGDRVGLIAFAGRPSVKVPLTTDQGFYRLVLDELDVDSAPRGGSLLGDAIRKGLTAMPPAADRDQVLILISDGGDQESYPMEAVEMAAERGVKIIAVGLGDPHEGARIPLTGSQSPGYLQYAGQEVWTKLEEDLLRKMALATGGAYIPARTQVYDLGQIYDEHLAGLTRGGFETTTRELHQERFQWFALLGLVLLVLEMLIPSTPRTPMPPVQEVPA